MTCADAYGLGTSKKITDAFMTCADAYGLGTSKKITDAFMTCADGLRPGHKEKKPTHFMTCADGLRLGHKEKEKKTWRILWPVPTACGPGTSNKVLSEPLNCTPYSFIYSRYTWIYLVLLSMSRN